jgi:hypothetical protein
MSSIMDVGLLQNFSNILVFLFVFAASYAIMKKTKIFGDSGSLLALIAFVIAIVVALNNAIIAFLAFVLPWFFILVLFLIFLIFIAKIFGKSDKDVAWAFNWKDKNTPIVTLIIILTIIIIGVGLSNLLGQDLLEKGQGQPIVKETVESEESVASTDYNSSVLATLSHPKVLGVIVVFIVAIAAILLLTSSGF